jgi:Tfp pilus assembly protein FimT
MLVMALIAVLAGITIPLFSLAVSRARTRGVAEALGAAIRDARTRAVSTGWNYQVVAFDANGAVPNAFRIEGMNPATGGVWPAATATPAAAFYGSNQMYEPYLNLVQEFGAAQIQIPGGGNTFTVTFDSSGQQILPCIPVTCQVQVTSGGRTATITVSAAGAVLIAK